MKTVRMTLSQGDKVLAVQERHVDVASAEEAVKAQPLVGSAKMIYDLLSSNDRPLDARDVDRTRRIGRYVDHIRQTPALFRCSPQEITAQGPERGFEKLYDMMDDCVKREFDAESDAEEMKKPMMVLYTLVAAICQEESLASLSQANDRHMRHLQEDIVFNGTNLKSCDFCGHPNGQDRKRLLRCARCRRVCYCGPQCQRKAWFEHKPFCSSN
jgi:hypothetical protein